jgi:hypothetical protein
VIISICLSRLLKPSSEIMRLDVGGRLLLARNTVCTKNPIGRHSGATPKAASPESIFQRPVFMDSGLPRSAPLRPRNDQPSMRGVSQESSSTPISVEPERVSARLSPCLSHTDCPI